VSAETNNKTNNNHPRHTLAEDVTNQQAARDSLGADRWRPRLRRQSELLMNWSQEELKAVASVQERPKELEQEAGESLDKFIPVGPEVQTGLRSGNSEAAARRQAQQQQQAAIVNSGKQPKRKQAPTNLQSQSAPASSAQVAPLPVGQDGVWTRARLPPATPQTSLQMGPVHSQQQPARWAPLLGPSAAGNEERERPDGAMGEPASSPSVQRAPKTEDGSSRVPSGAGSGAGGGRAASLEEEEEYALSRLYFDTSLEQHSSRVRADVGETVRLVCRLRANIQQLEELKVSWMKGMRILTFGQGLLTSDLRFKPIHPKDSNDWVLEIVNVRPEDQGDYECQVNSQPKPAKLQLHLEVLSARVKILEAPQLQVDEGEQIQLTCRVQFHSAEIPPPKEAPQTGRKVAPRASLELEAPSSSTWANGKARDQLAESEAARGQHLAGEAPRRKSSSKLQQKEQQKEQPLQQRQHYIYWYKDNVSLEYNNPRGHIQVKRENDEAKGHLQSELLLAETNWADSGTYECRLVPEISGVRGAQVEVLVGSPPSSSGSPRSRSKLSNVGALVAVFVGAAVPVWTLMRAHLSSGRRVMIF